MIKIQPLVLKPGCNTDPKTIRRQLLTNIKCGFPVLSSEHGKDVKNRPIAIVCGGPSLNDRWQELKDFDGSIMACNGSYRYLMDRGIVPDYFMLLDCRDENLTFINKMDRTTIHYVAAQASPKVFDRLKTYGAKVYMYLTNLPDLKSMIGDKLGSNYYVIGGTVGTVGIKSMALAHALGYRDMHLFGYDSSYLDDDHHAYSQPLNDNATTIEVFVDGRKYITSPTLANQAEQFPAWAKSLVLHAGCKIELHCHGLLPDFMNHCNRVGAQKTLKEREREKYEQIWSHDSYRKFSPGENLVDYAFKKMGMEKLDALVDFGCGTGRSIKKFERDYDMLCLGIDHANNCIDEGLKVSFKKACLWEPIKLYANYKWGYCTDVMEHIPTEKVMDVIKNISQNVKRGCFFNIATRDDSMGSLIGKKLHLTIANAGAWKDLLQKHFSKVVLDRETEGEAIFLCFK